MDKLPVPTLEPRYLAFIETFNRGEFFEAHEVLEPLWLESRQTPDGLFYKGLIQLAGAFVHVQKKRKSPAVALFKLAGGNLGKFQQGYRQLDLVSLHELINGWLDRLESDQDSVGPAEEEQSKPEHLCFLK